MGRPPTFCTVLLLGAALLACTPRSVDFVDSPAPPSSHEYNFVRAQARLVDSKSVAVRLINDGDAEICFWIPNIEFRVFSHDGSERSLGTVLPGSGLGTSDALPAGKTATTETRIGDLLRGDLQDGDCILFERVYFYCSDMESLRASGREHTIPVESGVAQGVWWVADHELRSAPLDEESCRAKSRLIHSEASP